MTDLQITREHAAEARRNALQPGDTPFAVSRATAPPDVGSARSLTFPTVLRVSMEPRKTRWCPVKQRDVDHEDECKDKDECDCAACSAGDQEYQTHGMFWSRSVGDDQDARIHLTGVASVTDRPYEMWDAFGPYMERISSIAFSQSLANNPDVAFLANHEGLSMARTLSRTLVLTPPLNVEAWLNPARQDVRDLVTAIRDGDINQMSFGATLEEGQWNEEFTEFEMTRLNLHCGDVSAVNFGANPFTAIAARSRNVLEEVGRLPEGTARSVLRALETRFQLPARIPEQAAAGRSIALVRSALLAEEDS
jgi:HK97 family phage prohead protease